MRQLKEDFVFPKPTQRDPQGRVIIFESQIIPQNFTSILDSLLSNYDEKSGVNSMQTSEITYGLSVAEELEHDLRMITNLMKLSGSIKIELIPGSENYIEKKQFSWEIIKHGENQIEIQFKYENPVFISAGVIDSMKITYENTGAWVIPEQSTMRSTPEGFTQVSR